MKQMPVYANILNLTRPCAGRVINISVARTGCETKTRRQSLAVPQIAKPKFGVFFRARWLETPPRLTFPLRLFAQWQATLDPQRTSPSLWQGLRQPRSSPSPLRRQHRPRRGAHPRQQRHRPRHQRPRRQPRSSPHRAHRQPRSSPSPLRQRSCSLRSGSRRWRSTLRSTTRVRGTRR